MKRYRRTACLIAMLLAAPLYGAEDVFNVDFFVGWEGHYRPMHWTPVEIGISSKLKQPYAGRLHVSAQQDSLNNLNVSQDIVLTPDMPLHIPMVIKLAYAADECRLALLDPRGRTQWHQTYHLWDYSENKRMVTPMEGEDLLVGLVGLHQFGLIQLSENTVSTSHGKQGNVYLKSKMLRMLPWDWTGYVSLDLLLLYDPDWTLINPHQVRAIHQWILNGGKLLCVLGSNPLPAQHGLAELMPVTFQQAQQVMLTPSFLTKCGLEASTEESVTAWPLNPSSPDKIGQRLFKNGSDILVANSYVGFGRVGVIAFNPNNLSPQQKTRTNLFWIRQVAELLEDNTHADHTMIGFVDDTSESHPIYRSLRLKPEQVDETNNNYYDYQIDQAQSAANAVLDHLYDIEEMRPLSIWWVILLLSALAILLGPVDFIMLKKLDRLPLTWITSTFWIVLFSVGAYYGVQALRSGVLQLRAVSVIDGFADGNTTWRTEYTGLFAPKSADYQLTDFADDQWYSAIAPSEQYLYSYRQPSHRRNIFCVQQDGANLPYSVPINIWTMQCLLNESQSSAFPFTARLQRDGETVDIEITNFTAHPMAGGYVLYDGNRALKFDTVAAQATQKFQGPLKAVKKWGHTNRSHQGQPIYYDFNTEKETVFFAQGCLQRTQAIQSFLTHGAAVVCAQFEQTPVSYNLKDRTSDNNHIQWARLVVYPNEVHEGDYHDPNKSIVQKLW